MAPQEPIKSAQLSQADFDVLQNRIAVGLAKREALVRSWTAAAGIHPSRKTDEELDAEDAALFRIEPPRLGVGAAIPSHFLVNGAQNISKSLRAKLLPSRGPKGSKARDLEEKAASAKRMLRVESSDDEEGRSGLGRAKKLRTIKLPGPMKNNSVDAGPKYSQPALQRTENNSIDGGAKGKKSKEKLVEDLNKKSEGEHTKTAQRLVRAVDVEVSRQFIERPTANSDAEVERKGATNGGKSRNERRENVERELVDRRMVDANDRSVERHAVLERRIVDAESERKEEKQKSKRPLQELEEQGAAAIVTDRDNKYSKQISANKTTDDTESKPETSIFSAKSNLTEGKGGSKLESVKAVENLEPTPGTLSRKQKKREKKKRKRERKRLTESEAAARPMKLEV